MSPKERLHDFLWSQEFYELMQIYRHTSIGKVLEVQRAFEAIKAAIMEHTK